MPETLPEDLAGAERRRIVALRAAASARRDEVVSFARRLVQTPGLPGAEGGTAAVVLAEMRALGYDEAWADAAGNVIGRLRGGPGRSVMLNTHLDHVDVGDPERWPLPPFAGTLHDGALWGRGAMDIKGPLACQVYAPAVLRDAHVQPGGDLYVTSVVMEELGGVGARLLLESLRPDMAVVGEATGLRLARGHRGRVEIEITFTGRSAHASVPERGANPHYAAARLMALLPSLTMAADAELGPATVAPTLYRTDQVSPNVIPGAITVTLDWRSVPAESVADVVARLAELASGACGPGVASAVRVREEAWRTYTGLERTLPSIAPAFRRPADDPLVTAAQALLAEALGAPVPDILWRFATDGGHFAAAGVPTIGFGPGDETLAHTVEERIDLDALERGLLGYATLAAHLGEMNG